MTKTPKFFIFFLIFFLINVFFFDSFANERKMRFFSFNHHPSVAKDIKSIFEQLGHEVVVADTVNFIDSNGKEVNSQIFNFGEWLLYVNQEKYDLFFEQFKDYLSRFDCFICPHGCTFFPYFAKFNKPIIVINAVRYEIPFTNKPELWKWLDNFLIDYVKTGNLFLVANNKGDQKYFKFYTGLDSKLIPSLCLYTNQTYTGKKKYFTCHLHRHLDLSNYVTQNHPDLIQELKKPYTYKDYYDYKGIIHFPYQNSTMSIFEQYSANIPLFFPSKKFLIELKVANKEVLGELSYCFLFGTKQPTTPGDPNNISDPKVLNFWINNSDFYDKKNMPYIQYFDSYEHLENLLRTANLQEISQKMKDYNVYRKKMVNKKWKKLLKKVVIQLETKQM